MLRTPHLLAAAALLMTPAMSNAQNQGPVPMIPATGPVLSLNVTESIESAPDMATINTGVQTRSMSARDAMTQMPPAWTS